MQAPQLVSTLSLIVAYCMLVFDGRYLVAIVPVLIAICCPLLLFLIWPHARHTYHRGCRRPGSDCSPRALSFSRSTGRLLFEQWTVISKPVATSRRCPSRRRAGGNAGQHRRWPLSGARCGIRSRAVFGVPCGMAAGGRKLRTAARVRRGCSLGIPGRSGLRPNLRQGKTRPRVAVRHLVYRSR